MFVFNILQSDTIFEMNDTNHIISLKLRIPDNSNLSLIQWLIFGFLGIFEQFS